jgi:hypothetical protein
MNKTIPKSMANFSLVQIFKANYNTSMLFTKRISNFTPHDQPLKRRSLDNFSQTEAKALQRGAPTLP